MKTRVAAYLRVSTASQKCDLQRDAIEQAAMAKGWSVTYFEEQASGGDSKRPVLENLLKRIEQGEFKVLAIWKLDRLCRSLPHLLQVQERLKAAKASLYSDSEQIDLSTPMGVAFVNVLGAIGQLERDLIKERVAKGIQAHRKRTSGKWGRREKPLNMLEVKKYRKEGLSLRAIGKKLGVSHVLVGQRIKAEEGC